MTDEIASFKVTAADIQKQEVHPSGDAHMRDGGHFSHIHLVFQNPKISMDEVFRRQRAVLRWTGSHTSLNCLGSIVKWPR